MTTLTDSEFAVFLEIKKGLSNKQIALNLNIKEKTVKDRLTRIYKKFGVTSDRSLMAGQLKAALNSKMETNLTGKAL